LNTTVKQLRLIVEKYKRARYKMVSLKYNLPCVVFLEVSYFKINILEILGS